MSNIKAIHGDSELEIRKIPSESIDIVCIDPPYLYLVGQRLERPFDEQAFFAECKRVLTKDGMIIMFGRGESFYRWNTILANLGLKFKEEIVWNKKYSSSPLMNIIRVHETISIFSKGGGVRKVRVPYLEMKGHDLDAIITDVKRLRTVFGNPKSLEAVLSFLQDRRVVYCTQRGVGPTVSSSAMDINRYSSVIQSMEEGMVEKTIISIARDHYNTIHPTQKPVRLLERLLNLCLPKGKDHVLVADFFAGSFSCAEACHNLGVDFIGVEIDEEYYNAGMGRIKKFQERDSEELPLFSNDN
jgi:DNA (cytosine-5-)-methyltransferase